MLQKLFHVNICVHDMERSIRFYQDLGFTKVKDFTLDDPSVGDALGLKVKKLRGVFMRLGDDPDSPVLDLVEFIDPPPQGQPTRRSTTSASAASPSPLTISTGHTRICRQRRSNVWRRSRKSRDPTVPRSAWSASRIRMARSSN